MVGATDRGGQVATNPVGAEELSATSVRLLPPLAVGRPQTKSSLGQEIEVEDAESAAIRAVWTSRCSPGGATMSRVRRPPLPRGVTVIDNSSAGVRIPTCRLWCQVNLTATSAGSVWPKGIIAELTAPRWPRCRF